MCHESVIHCFTFNYICEGKATLLSHNILGHRDNLIMQNLTFSHYWFLRGPVCLPNTPSSTGHAALSPPVNKSQQSLQLDYAPEGLLKQTAGPISRASN